MQDKTISEGTHSDYHLAEMNIKQGIMQFGMVSKNDQGYREHT
jgi:hypothetical protein